MGKLKQLHIDCGEKCVVNEPETCYQRSEFIPSIIEVHVEKVKSASTKIPVKIL